MARPRSRKTPVVLLSLALLAAPLVAARQAGRPVQGPGMGPIPRDASPRPPAAQPVAAGTALVSGVVLSADANRPVRRATVRLGTGRGADFTATSDDQGRFQFDKLSAGQYTLTASKPGYLDSVYGQRRPGSGRPGTPVSITEGQRVERLSLPIARGGVLAGTVTDDVGEPSFGTDVKAFRYQWQGGERVLRLAGSAKADDRGGFRIGALLPGDYVVMAGGAEGAMDSFMMPRIAAVGSGSVMRMPPMALMNEANAALSETGYAPVFYPNATSGRGAVVIALDVSEERLGIDLQMPLVPYGRITGTLTGETGLPASAEIRLTNADDPLPELNMRTTVSQPDGQFTFHNVPPGRYRLDAQSGARRTVIVDQVAGESRVQMQFMRAAPGPGTPFPPPGGRMGPAFDEGEASLWATSDVSVSGRDVQHVPLALRRGMTVSGQIAFDASGQPPADLTSIRLVFNTGGATFGSGQSALGQVAQDGSFAIANVAPGAYRVSVLDANGWRPKSFDVAGRDALDFLLDVQPDRNVANAVVTMTRASTQLSGAVRDAAGQPAVAYTIVMFAEDPAYWTPQSRRIQATRPATDGTFSIGNLPAGRYRLAALEDLEDGQWFDPNLLKQAAGVAIPITLADAEKKIQDIRVQR